MVHPLIAAGLALIGDGDKRQSGLCRLEVFNELRSPQINREQTPREKKAETQAKLKKIALSSCANRG